MIRTYNQIMDSIAGLYIHNDLDLSSRVIARLNQKRSFLQTLRSRPALAVTLAILALLLLTGVAYALGRLTGYIQGVGLIDQSAPLRVLSRPVSQTRDGVTLTVQEAVLTADKTVIVFALDGVQWSTLSHDENVGGCSGLPEIHLPDGTSLQFSEGGSSAGRNRLVYGPVPADVNDATLILPCIQGTLPGKAPENWELPLRFAPAPSDMKVVPVIEIAPTVVPQTVSTQLTENALSLVKVLEVGDTYLLFVEFRSLKPQGDGIWWNETGLVRIVDGNGQDVLYTFPNDIDRPAPTQPDSRVEVYQITKNFTPPLTISYPGIYIEHVGAPQSFELDFDTGKNPQPREVWTVNQDFLMDGYSIRLVSIAADDRDTGYTFAFDHTTPVNLFDENSHVLGVENVDLEGYTAIGGGGGGGNISKVYKKIPTGKLKIVVTVRHTHSLNKKIWEVQWSPGAHVDSPYGITLKLDRYIPLDDGYYLIGHTEWTDMRITEVSPASWALKAYDARGQEVPIEPANWQDAGLTQAPNQWLYKIYGKNFNAPISLHVRQMDVMFKEPVRMILDMRAYPFKFSDDQLGVPYKTGQIPLSVPGVQANAFKATYVKSGDLHGFEIAIQADSALQGLPFAFESGLDTSGLSQIAGGGGSNRDEAAGLVLSTVLTNTRMSFPLVFRADGATINGVWEVDWNPSMLDARATPVLAAQACVTLEKWEQVSRSPSSIPAGLPKLALVSRGAIAPDPSLFISALDGSTEQGLVFGNGSLSPDGAKLVYSGADDRLYIMDVTSKQSAPLTNGTFDQWPFWSPDGRQIAFERQTAKGLNIFLMDADGHNVHVLTDITDNLELAGWASNSQQLVVSDWQKGNIQLLDVNSGAMRPLFSIGRPWDGSAFVSPDGKWIAYVDRVQGKMTPGIFVSRLDGTEQRLLIQLDTWGVGLPIWSPDGIWLAFRVLNMDAMNPEGMLGLVNVKTCQVVPLVNLKGEIRGWMK